MEENTKSKKIKAFIRKIPFLGKCAQFEEIESMECARNKVRNIQNINNLEKYATFVSSHSFHSITSHIITILFGIVGILQMFVQDVFPLVMAIGFLIFGTICLSIDFILSMKATRGANYVLLAIDEMKSKKID